MMNNTPLDEKALETAWKAVSGAGYKHLEPLVEDAIRAYLDATPAHQSLEINMFDANKLADGKWHVILIDGEGETVIASAINETVAKDTAAALNFYHYYTAHRRVPDAFDKPDGYRVHPADQKRWDVV